MKFQGQNLDKGRKIDTYSDNNRRATKHTNYSNMIYKWNVYISNRQVANYWQMTCYTALVHAKAKKKVAGNSYQDDESVALQTHPRRLHLQRLIIAINCNFCCLFFFIGSPIGNKWIGRSENLV